MILWVDAQLPPAIAPWLEQNVGVEAKCVRELGLRQAKDIDIFHAARAANAVIMTKDSDFVELVRRLGTPPQVLWVTCGNTTNARLREILGTCLSIALPLLVKGEPIVEINDSTGRQHAT